jgi:hypothetical protein
MKSVCILSVALVLGLASCSTQSGSWKYQSSDDKSITHGRAGQDLSIQSEGVTVQFCVPEGWKIVDSFEEPLDWDFAADAPHDAREFGVVVRKDKRGRTAQGRYEDYLKNVHDLYDTKVRMVPDDPFVLKDGRTLTPYRYYSEYWKQRLVIILPQDGAMTIFEFTAPTLESLKSSHEAIQQMLGSYTSRKSTR